MLFSHNVFHKQLRHNLTICSINTYLKQNYVPCRRGNTLLSTSTLYHNKPLQTQLSSSDDMSSINIQMTHNHTIVPADTSAFETQATNIRKLSIKTYPAFQPTPFNFTLSKEAAANNSTIIENSGIDLSISLADIHQNTQLAYGSEFRPVNDLEPILHFGPVQKTFSSMVAPSLSTPQIPNWKRKSRP